MYSCPLEKDPSLLRMKSCRSFGKVKSADGGGLKFKVNVGRNPVFLACVWLVEIG